LHPHPPLCDHLQPNGWPFEVELIIDEQMGFTDALVTCRTCGAPYLLEMLDWRGRQRLMRVSTVESGRVTGLLHNLGRGSCDLRRAAAEVQQLQAGAEFSPWLLLLDATAMRIEAIVPVPKSARLPTAGWRALPCDGWWIDAAVRGGASMPD
jgi:hypothetical protein